MGSYKNFNESLKLLTYHEYIHYLDLRHWVNKAMVLPFYSESARDGLRTSFDEILKQPQRKFSESIRFPIGYYAKLGDSEIGEALTDALRALDLPTADAPIQGYNYQNIDITAAKKKFDAALNKIIDIIDCLDPKKLFDYGIYTQTTFENAFGLIWNETMTIF